MLIPLIVVFVLIVLPGLTASGYYLYFGWLILYYLVLSLGWNMSLLGGLGVLGNYGYVGIGAYAYAFAVIHGISLLLAFTISGVLPVLVMLPFLFLLKLRGSYLAIGTFVVPIIIESLIKLFPDITGGGVGLYIPFNKVLSQTSSYFLLAALSLISVGLTALILWSKYGLALRSMYDDEEAAEVNGVNTYQIKIMVFLLPAFLSGLVGAALASSLSFVETALVFFVGDQVNMILAVVIGGARTLYGPIVGAVIITVLVLGLGAYLPYSHLATFGLLMMIATILRQSDLRSMLARLSPKIGGGH
jgi:branched-chain amino acid transport system permease protein